MRSIQPKLQVIDAPTWLAIQQLAAKTQKVAQFLTASQRHEKSRRRCMPEYDLRFSRYFGTYPGFLAPPPVGL